MLTVFSAAREASVTYDGQMIRPVPCKSISVKLVRAVGPCLLNFDMPSRPEFLKKMTGCGRRCHCFGIPCAHVSAEISARFNGVKPCFYEHLHIPTWIALDRAARARL